MPRPKKTEKVEGKYKVALSVNGIVLNVDGSTLEEAIELLEFGQPKTKGILTVTHGDKKVIKMLNIITLKRAFGGAGTNTQKLSLGFIIGNLKFLLGEKYT